MATNKVTNSDTNFDESASELPSSVRPEKPQPSRVYFYPLPNYINDGLSHPRARDNENAVMLPYKDGYFERFQEMAEPGFYAVELRDGKNILSTTVQEVVAPVVRVEPELEDEVEDDELDEQPDVADLVAAASTAAAQAAREAVREMVAAERERAQAAAPQPPTPAQSISATAEMIRALKELSSEVAPQPQAQPVQQSTGVDSFEQVMMLVDKVTEIQARFAPPPLENPSASTFEKVLSVADSVMKNAPRLLPLLAAMYQQRPNAPVQVPQPVQVQPVQPVTATSESTNEEAINNDAAEALDELMENLADDLKNGADAKQSAKEVARFVEDYPEHEELVRNVLGASPLALLELGAQVVEEPLHELPGAEKFAAELHAEVTRRLNMLNPSGLQNRNGIQVSPTTQ